MAARIPIDPRVIEDFCRRHHIRRLSLFGSVIRDDYTPESDVDVLVESEPGKTPGLAFFAMQDEHSELLGRRVDLNTPGLLSRYSRENVLAGAEPRHVAAYHPRLAPRLTGLRIRHCQAPAIARR